MAEENAQETSTTEAEASTAAAEVAEATTDGGATTTTAATESETTTEPAAKGPTESADDYDRDRAFSTIQRQRENERRLNRELREALARNKEFEDASKTDEERRAQRLRDLAEGKAKSDAEAARAVGEAARLRIVLKKGLTGDKALALAKRLVGETEDELEQDADELLASFNPEDRPRDESRRRPQERLKPGTVPGAEPEERDPRKLASQISNGW